MKNAVKKNLDLFEALLEINYEVAMLSTNEEDKKSLLNTWQISKKDLDKFRNKTSNYPSTPEVREAIEGFLIFWNEALTLDSERFWYLVESRNLNVKRKRSLANVLKRGRFLDIHEVIPARPQWQELIESDYLKRQFTRSEIKRIDEIMREDEIKRVKLFRKCLRNNRVSNSDFMNLCNNMAYFSMSNLYEDHFTQDEVKKM